MSKDPNQKVSAPQVQRKENFKIRSQQLIHHHLFKAEDAQMKKNVSYKKFSPRIESITHAHFFHSVNSHGMPQRLTNFVGGHFHEVKWKIGPDGEPIAECGPALQKVIRKTPVGDKMVTVPVSWPVHNDEGEESKIVDNHTHVMVYKGTDILTPEKVQAIQNANVVGQLPKGDSFENDEVKMSGATTPRS